MYLLMSFIIGMSLASTRKLKSKREPNRIRDEYQLKDCVVCWEIPPSIWLQPCGHTCICSRCFKANTFTECPLCRCVIKDQSQSLFRGTRVKYGDQIGYFMDRTEHGEFVIEVPRSQEKHRTIHSARGIQIDRYLDFINLEDVEIEVIVLPKSSNVKPMNQKKIDKNFEEGHKALENHEVNAAIAAFERCLLKDSCNRYAMVMVKACYDVKAKAISMVFIEREGLTPNASNSLIELVNKLQVGDWRHPRIHVDTIRCFYCGKDNAEYGCIGCEIGKYCDFECARMHWWQGHRSECLGLFQKASRAIGTITLFFDVSSKRDGGVIREMGVKPPNEIFVKKSEKDSAEES